MNLKELAAATTKKARNHSILIYGPPKTGKTQLVGTAAKIKELDRIFWIDLENGVETLLHMGLSDEELAKVTLIHIPDTREVPRGIETVLKMFSAKNPIKICEVHGKVDCVECNKEGVSFCLKDLTNRDLVVIDSGSQLGDSAMALACIGKDITYKPTFDDYGAQTKWLGDIMSTIQAAAFTNFCLISHEIVIEEDVNGVKRDKIYPLVGTRNFCTKVGKYFGTVAYTEKKMGKHVAGSSSLYKPDVITGSRVGAKLEASKDAPDMRTILIDSGIIQASK